MHPSLVKARAFAQKAHNVQPYGHIYPYYIHLQGVSDVLSQFGFTEEANIDLQVSAWLHDSLEDTATSYSDVKKEFGVNVAEIVYCVTDERGRNRKERHEKTYPKIRSNMQSIILKVADRISNVKFSLTQSDKGKFEMYKKEHVNFVIQLRIHNHISEMWEYLDKLMTEV